MQKTFIRDRETWQAYFILSFYGFLLNILGPLTPYLRDELQISYTTAGFHFSAFAIGMLLSGLFGERVQSRWGYTRTIWFSAFGMTLGSLVFLAGQVVALTIFGAFLMGILGTGILSAVNAGLSLKYKEQSAVAMTEMNVVASFMGMSSPLLVGLLAPTVLTWRAAVAVALLGLGLLAAIFLRSDSLVTKTESKPQGNAKAHLPLQYWLYWSIVFLSVAVEFCIIFWGSDFLAVAGGLARETAVLSLTLFLGAMLVGRVFGSRILRRFAAPLVLRAAIGLTAFGFLLFWTALTPWLAILGLFVTGLGIANLYPTTISLAMGSVPDVLSAQASARLVLASGAAILSLPLILGGLADWVGMRLAFLVVPVLLALVMGLGVAASNNRGTHKFSQQEI
jgi:fucose permease